MALAFLVAISIGTLGLMLPVSRADGASADFLVALFTATSAVCVTGLVLVDTGTYWSGFGQALIMLLFQLGGLGMMASATLLGLAVSGRLSLRSRLLAQTETHARQIGDVKGIAIMILVVTVIVEAFIALWLAVRFASAYDMGWAEAAWQGVFHAVSAFNNAGFSTWSDGLIRFATDGWLLVPLMIAIVVGGLGFPVLHELYVTRGTRRRRSMHTVLTLWGSGVLVVLGALAILLAEWNNGATLAPMSFPAQVMNALFASVSARTAGFNAIDTGSLNIESLAVHYVLMFIGGGSAGTAGGVKVTTAMILLLIVWNEIRGHRDVEFRGRRVAPEVQRQALTILVLSAATICIAVLLLLPMTSFPIEKVVFEVISAFSTVGLSTGITAQLPAAGQLILVALMFIGRVGVVTFAAAMAMNHGRRPYRYPEEKPIVG